MERMPRFTIEIDGMDDLKGLLAKATKQADELRETIDQIDIAKLVIQTKINVPQVSGYTAPYDKEYVLGQREYQ